MNRFEWYAAGLGQLVIALAAAPAWAEDDGGDQYSAAQKMFEAGDDLYDSGHFEQAVEAFRSSYQLVISPNSRLMLARSLRELGRWGEAIREFQGAIDDAQGSGGRYADALVAAQAELQSLRNRSASIELADDESVPSEGRIDGMPVTLTLKEPLYQAPGRHTVELTYSDGRHVKRTLDLVGGEVTRLDLEPEASAEKETNLLASSAAPVRPEPDSGQRTWAYVAGSAGLAGLIGFGVFGMLDRSTHEQLQSTCDGSLCPPEQADRIDRGRRYQLLANVSLAVGIVGLATGTTLYLTSDHGSGSRESVALHLGLDGASVGTTF